MMILMNRCRILRNTAQSICNSLTIITRDPLSSSYIIFHTYFFKSYDGSPNNVCPWRNSLVSGLR